jgi:cardiolipin synthase
VATASPATNRVITVPNVITVIRLCCIPVFLWLLFGVENRYAAAFLLGGLGATDWVDGYVARRYGQVSELGKVLDSILVVVREVIVGGTLAALTMFGMKRFDVSWWGKAGTFGLMVAFPCYLMGSAGDGVGNTLFWVGGWLVGVPALILSYYAAVTYIPLMRHALAEGRRARVA